ncbi:MAG TPA: hypothetical protein VF174_01250 [Micromonosporaceae bacterium]
MTTLLRRSIAALATLAGVTIAVAGCAGAAPDGAPGTAGRTPPAGEPSPGALSLIPDAATYRPGSVITLTIANDGRRTVYVEDQKTDCSPVMLWRQDVAYDNCGAERAPRITAIQPGERHTVRIDLGSANFAERPAEPGDYRAVLGYRFGEQPHGEEAARVSADLAIG